MRGGCDELNTNSRSIFYHNDNHIFAESRKYRYCLSLVFNIVLIFFFGMGEKMTKSFDDAVSKHKNKLIENLSQFNEGHRVRGLLMDIESNKSDSEYYFNAGQQSKQAKVDELQKRIDEAMKYVSESPLKDVSRRAMINFMDILKGNKNDH